MKKKFHLLSSLFAAAILISALSWGTSLSAQDTSQAHRSTTIPTNPGS